MADQCSRWVCARGERAEASVAHRHEPRDDDIVVEPAEGRQSEVLAGRGWGGRRLLVVEQAGSSGVAAAPPLVHLAPAKVAGHCTGRRVGRPVCIRQPTSDS